ncbi:SDR family oxidoreductase [bacterium]|nr:SDR family oxidoreductase [bacterium]
MSAQTIVLTGASGGIGRALTEYFLENKLTNLVCQYKTHDEALFEVLREHGLDTQRHSFHADLTDENEVHQFGEFTRKNFGQPWAVINLAGASTNAMSWKLAKDEFIRIMQSNLLTTFLTSKEFIPGMREANGGRLINISSVVAFTGIAGASHYAAAKAAIIGLTKSMAQELSSKNITANALALGYFDYGLIKDVPETMLNEIKARVPLKRLGLANEIGGMIRFLISDDGAFTTGQVLHINGGLY